MSETYNPAKAREAQEKYCNETGTPHFAPNSGRCWKCGQNIYEQIEKISRYSDKTYTTGISVEEARERLVTGCPHCNRSYVD